jgi:hypothetical protein
MTQLIPYPVPGWQFELVAHPVMGRQGRITERTLGAAR